MASKQDELRAQIAALEKQIALEDAQEDRKRKANTGVLVAASPSPTSAFSTSIRRVVASSYTLPWCRKTKGIGEAASIRDAGATTPCSTIIWVLEYS